MSIKRYGTRHDWIEGGVIGIGPDDNGRYVLYTDHAAEVERLTVERDALASAGDDMQSVLFELRGMLETQDHQRVYDAFEPQYGTLADLINNWIAAR